MHWEVHMNGKAQRNRPSRAIRFLIPFCVLPGMCYSQQVAPSGNPLDVLPQAPRESQESVRPEITPPPAQPNEILSQVITPRQFDIVGVRSMPFPEVAKLFVPLAGQSVSVARIVEVAAEVTKLYQDAGYALSFAFVPPQEFKDGNVQVVIVEGYIASLEIEGDAGKSEALLRSLAEPLLAEKPLRTTTFERQSQLMARLPGVQVAVSAQLPTTMDGATTLRLSSKHKPLIFSIGGEIRQPTSRAIASLTANDLLGGGGQLQASTLLRSFDTERFLSLSYAQVVNSQGTMVKGSLSDYRGVAPDSEQLPGIDDITRQRRVELSVSHPLHLRARESVLLSGGMYGVDYSRTYEARSTGNALRDSQNIRVLFGQLAWSQVEAHAAHSASVLLAHGVSGAGAKIERSNNFGATLAADETRLDFTRITLDASTRRRFSPSGWGGALMMTGQYSPHILPVPERITFGASRFARGYQAGQAAGDSGLGVGVEVNHSFPASGTWLKHWEPYLLYEAARTWMQQEGAVPAKLRSASVGVRFGDGRYYSADIAVSKPLGDAALENPDRKVRLSLLLSYNLDVR
jgi:hemolysin activation/secretion protein